MSERCAKAVGGLIRIQLWIGPFGGSVDWVDAEEMDDPTMGRGYLTDQKVTRGLAKALCKYKWLYKCGKERQDVSLAATCLVR